MWLAVCMACDEIPHADIGVFVVALHVFALLRSACVYAPGY